MSEVIYMTLDMEGDPCLQNPIQHILHVDTLLVHESCLRRLQNTL